jgi:hypothetical protein
MSIFTNTVPIILSASRRNVSLLFAELITGCAAQFSPFVSTAVFCLDQHVALASRFISVNLACKISPICVLKHDAIKGKEDNDEIIVIIA